MTNFTAHESRSAEHRSARISRALIFTVAFFASAFFSPAADSSSHYAFQKLQRPPVPAPPAGESRTLTPLDHFIAAPLHARGLALGAAADRHTLIRRVVFTLTGLPPTPEEIAGFVADTRADAFERMALRYLDSPRHAEHWAKHWLDAAGYADSNGYFNADTDRPLAHRYRDYVIRAIHRDKPFDQFIREQIAGDELSGWKPGQPASPEIIELLEATHFLRNGQDGSGESDGNPDEVRTDRYYALESTMQIMGTSLLGLTLQCAKCHDHKFEPFTQRDYYALQSFLYPAFNIEKWVTPQNRFVFAHLPGELESWQENERKLDAEESALRKEFNDWTLANRPRGRVLFEDRFDTASLAERWSDTAPGDDTPGGKPAVTLDSDRAPGAIVKDGSLQIIEGGPAGDRWISTKTSFEWLPKKSGEWIQTTFDLVAMRVEKTGKAAERIGYFIALRDFAKKSPQRGGDILIDGNPGGPTSVHVNYPGKDSASRGSIGKQRYEAGHNFGVRITRKTGDAVQLEHLVDGAVDGASITLKAADLPPGGFGFEYCCGRSFIVDNVVIEASNGDDAAWTAKQAEFQKALAERKKSFDQRLAGVTSRRVAKPGKIAWVSDLSSEPPVVRVLKRGDHKSPGDPIAPAFPAFLTSHAPNITPTAITTGRRRAWAEWITEKNSPQAALLARVTVNRIWQHYFGAGIVATPDNLGLSGAKPTHPELLEWLAAELVDSGWSVKAVHKKILASLAFQQSAAPHARGLERDPANQFLWRFPLRRLDAECIRDAMLAACGRLDAKSSGPYVPTSRSGAGEVLVDESKPGAFARSLFLQRRRTQVPTFLGTFDTPSIVFNCTRRADTTMPLQALSLLNSEMVVKRGADLAGRLASDCDSDAEAKLTRAFLLTTGRAPTAPEAAAARSFLDAQQKIYADKPDAAARAWADFCQSLFGLNAFLYLE